MRSFDLSSAARLPFALLALLACIPTAAYAGCTGPTGNAGDIQFSTTQGVMAYCNGTGWINMGTSSTTSFGTFITNDFCTATSGTAISCTTGSTGTGNVALSASPSFTGTISGVNGTFSGQLAVGTSTLNGALNVSGIINATNFVGGGAGLTGIGTSSLSATGTANATTFLRGDNTWGTALTALPSLTSGYLWVGNNSNVATAVALSGDCTITNTGAITCTKTNGSSFGALATAASANLASQVTGTLPIANGGTNATTQNSNGVAYFNGASLTTATSFVTNGSNVGIGTATATNTLTVNGTTAFQYGTNYTTTGAQQDVAINSYSSVRYTGSSAATFYGIAAGQNGQVLYLHNGSTSTLTLSNKSASETTAANQIVTGTGADLQIAANSAVTLQYDNTATNSSGATGAWRIIGGSGGGTPGGSNTQVQFNAGGSFGGDSKLTWDNTNKLLAAGTGAATPLGTSGTVASVTMNVISNGSAFGSLAGLAGTTAINPGATGQMAYYSAANAISATPNLYVSGANIALGTSSASYLLSLDGQSARTIGMQRDYTASTAGQSLTLQAGGAVTSGSNLNGGNLVLTSGVSTGTGTSQIQFQTFPGTVGTATSDNTAATAMTITGAGNVGIGTTGPGQLLEVNGTAKIDTGIIAGLHYPSADSTTAIQFDKANGSTNVMNIDTTNSRVGIGTTSPSYVLDVTGQARFTGSYTTSDRRWKTNIHPITGALDSVNRLQGVTYDWRRKEFSQMRFAEGRQIGFIAQDVEKVMPDIVATDQAGFKNVSYQSVTPLLVEAVKELKAANDNLTARHVDDEKAIESLKAANQNFSLEIITIKDELQKLESAK